MVFCERCGVALGAVSVSTKQLESEEDDLAAGSPHLSQDHVVLMHISGYEDPVALQVDDQVMLGRIAPEDAGGMALNLETYKAIEHGVSRRHAVLMRDGTHLYIRDLQSTNYTYLNGEKLEAERDYSLRDGDEVMLGRLTFKLFFK